MALQRAASVAAAREVEVNPVGEASLNVLFRVAIFGRACLYVRASVCVGACTGSVRMGSCERGRLAVSARKRPRARLAVGCSRLKVTPQAARPRLKVGSAAECRYIAE